MFFRAFAAGAGVVLGALAVIGALAAALEWFGGAKRTWFEEQDGLTREKG